MKRIVLPIVLALGLVLTGCSDPLADEIATYDPAEVQMLRDQATAANFESDDESMLAILKYREGCRDMRAGLDAVAAGTPEAEVADGLDTSLIAPYETYDPETADYNQDLIDQLRLGNTEPMQQNHALNCASVP